MAFAWLVVVAIMFRAAVPAGFMPDIGNHHPFKMVICSLEGSKTILVDKDFKPFKADTRQHRTSDHHGPCPFSINNALNAGFDYPALITAQISYGLPLPVAANAEIVQLRFFGNSSSQAPPPSYA